MSADLTKVDSGVAGLSISKDDKTEKTTKKDKDPKRATSDAGVRNINDLGKYFQDVTSIY
jgi:hypothetical protein